MEEMGIAGSEAKLRELETEGRETMPIRALIPRLSGPADLECLLKSGHVRPARLDLSRLGPPPALPTEMSISEALLEQRAEGRRGR